MQNEKTPAIKASTAPALIVGHPGHELRLYGWMSTEKPNVHVLTTGSRHSSDFSRIKACGDMLGRLGVSKGQLFGTVQDTEFYGVVRQARTEQIHKWVDVLRDDLLASGNDLVVFDAWQGFSPTHDLAHVMARVAALEAQACLTSAPLGQIELIA
jgi:hypothetical protein